MATVFTRIACTSSGRLTASPQHLAARSSTTLTPRPARRIASPPTLLHLSTPRSTLLKLSGAAVHCRHELLLGVGHQDLLSLVSLAWSSISNRALRYGFKRAGLGLPLDGTEDDLVWAPDDAGEQEHREGRGEQRARTVAHEGSRASPGRAEEAARRQAKEASLRSLVCYPRPRISHPPEISPPEEFLGL